MLLPCCCTPCSKIKRSRDVLTTPLAVLSLVFSSDLRAHIFYLPLLEFFSNSEGISFVYPKISFVSLVFFPREPFVVLCASPVALLSAHSFVHLSLEWLLSDTYTQPPA